MSEYVNGFVCSWKHINQNMDSSHTPLDMTRYSPQAEESAIAHYLQNHKDVQYHLKIPV
jgi:hypothetical protein